jgi:hypothetical protein
MKTLLRLLIIGGLLSASSVLSLASAFEGKVSLSMSSGKGRPQVINYAIKGSSLRMEIEAEGKTMAQILDLEKQEMIMLMPEEEMYMVMPFKEAVKKVMEEEDLKQNNLEKTGRTETILGYKCEEYVSKEKNTTTEIWIAEGLGTFMGISGGGNPMMGGGRARGAAWENALKGKPGFPLRVVSRDAKSKETFKMEVTKIEPARLPASLFQPPANWERFQMPDLGGLNPFKKR